MDNIISLEEYRKTSALRPPTLPHAERLAGGGVKMHAGSDMQDMIETWRIIRTEIDLFREELRAEGKVPFADM